MICEVFPGDPALRKLAVASDARQMLEVFRAHLRPVRAVAYEIRDCKLVRLRYRRGNRCILQYELCITNRTTGEAGKQWVSGQLHADDRAQRRWKRLKTTDRGPGFAETFATFEPVSFIPELGMLVQVFPQDRRLPSLPILAAGPPIELQSTLLARFGRDDWRMQKCGVEPIAYRAGLGAVFRYVVHARSVTTGETAKRCFYVKIYNDDHGDGTDQLLRTLSARGVRERDTFAVAEPVAYLANLQALVLEEASGVSLREILLQDQGSLGAIRKVARALAGFQLSDVAVARRYTREDETASLTRATARIRSGCPELMPEVAGTVRAIIAGFEDAVPHPTHRDVKPDHVLLDDERVKFIDLDSCAAADPVLDPADLVSRIGTMQLPGDRARAAAQAFVEEYFALVPPSWRDRFAVHYAGAHIHLAAGYFRDQPPGWREQTVNSIREAARSMKSEIW